MHSRLVLPFFGAQLATSTSGNRRRSNAVPEPDCLADSLWDRRYESFCPLTPRREGLSRNALSADFSTSEGWEGGILGRFSKLNFPRSKFSNSLQSRSFNSYSRGGRRKRRKKERICDHAWIDKSRGGRPFPVSLIIEERRR